MRVGASSGGKKEGAGAGADCQGATRAGRVAPPDDAHGRGAEPEATPSPPRGAPPRDSEAHFDAVAADDADEEPEERA